MKYLISTALALTLLGSSAALAQPYNPNHQGQNPPPFQNNAGPGDRQGFNGPNFDQPHWSRGDRLPDQYRNRQNPYVVNDWRQRNLRKPPRGYHWVRHNDNQYFLAAIMSGIILDVFNQNQYRNDYRWSRGERLSSQYRGGQYVISDWRSNHLRRPPRGHRWVHVNNQYLLIAITSGLIADAIFYNQ